MAQTIEATQFLRRLSQPGSSWLSILQPSLDDDATLRRLFATDRKNARLNDIYVGLVDIYGNDTDAIGHTRPRDGGDDPDHYVMPLGAEERKKKDELAFVSIVDQFRDNWDTFTNGSLKNLRDWSNVIAAGGSVLACAMPLPDNVKSTKDRAAFYHEQQYPESDVDLFLWGLTPEQAEKKANEIYIAVRNSAKNGCTCVRTTHAISIHTQYPTRAVQIVLRLYHSPAEVLAGFDIDAACAAYDGKRVWASPRAVIAVMSQHNAVDLSRRSPSYEFRLEKYRKRGFEVYVPQKIDRSKINNEIYERRLSETQGLARLLLLEKLREPSFRKIYFETLTSHDEWSSPPRSRFYHRLRYRKEQGDRKAQHFRIAGASDYDSIYQIPYGPKFDNKKIRLDLQRHENRMEERNRDQYLHQHFAFWGTMRDCIEGGCEVCPVPRNEEEVALQKKNDQFSVRGHVQFMQNDPGRQSISGSFHPIDDDDWHNQAYGIPMSVIQEENKDNNIGSEATKQDSQEVESKEVPEDEGAAKPVRTSPPPEKSGIIGTATTKVRSFARRFKRNSQQ